MIFVFAKEYEKPDLYFTIKINKITGENENEVMISFQDMSNEIKSNNEKAHNELLIMINATVSHELRNPLNSIVALNLQKEMLYNKIQELINNDNIS